MSLDHPEAIEKFTNLYVVPSQNAFESMNASQAFSWFHWHLMRQPAPFPENMIGANPKLYRDFLFHNWTNVEEAITKEAYAEYLRCFSNPDTIRATCSDYRSVELDLEHDAIDQEQKLRYPVLVRWGGLMPKRTGWQAGSNLGMLTVWNRRADNVRGKSMNCGHFIPEEPPDELAYELISFYHLS